MIPFSIGLFLLLGFISFATYRTAQLLETWKPANATENLLLLPFENLARLVMIGVAVGLGLLSGRGPEALGWLPQQPWTDVLIGVAIGVTVSIILLPPSLWVKRRHPQWQSDAILNSIRPRTRRQWPLVLLALVPVALLEEMLFRSLLLGGFAPYVDVMWFAVAVSIFFGLLHRPQGEWGVLAVTLVSLVFSALFLWRHSLLLVVTAHWAVNVGQLLLAEWMEKQDAKSPAD